MTNTKLVEEILKIACLLDSGDITLDGAQARAEMLVKLDRFEQAIESGAKKVKDLKVLVHKGGEAKTLCGHECTLLGYKEELFLVEYKHNEQSDWVTPSDLEL